LLNIGKGKFTMLKDSPTHGEQNPTRIAIGDVNGDGKNDIVTFDFNGNRIYVFFISQNDNLTS
jgi:hypothetical protein